MKIVARNNMDKDLFTGVCACCGSAFEASRASLHPYIIRGTESDGRHVALVNCPVCGRDVYMHREPGKKFTELKRTKH